MKKTILTAVLAAVALTVTVSDAQAGILFKRRGGGSCGSANYSYSYNYSSSSSCNPCQGGTVIQGTGGGGVIGVPSTSGFYQGGTPYYPNGTPYSIQPSTIQPGTIYSSPSSPANPVILPMPGAPGTITPGTTLPPIGTPGTGNPSGYAPLPDTKPGTVYILDEKGQLQKAPADWQKRSKDENPLKIK